MENIQKIIVTYIVTVNIIAYVFMWVDKYQSKKRGQRIPENTLLFLSFVLGASGIYLGMKAPIYHKAANSKFKWGIPLLLVLNIICVFFVYNSLFKLQ